MSGSPKPIGRRLCQEEQIVKGKYLKASGKGAEEKFSFFRLG
jgi:hypothetical protein